MVGEEVLLVIEENLINWGRVGNYWGRGGIEQNINRSFVNEIERHELFKSSI